MYDSVLLRTLSTLVPRLGVEAIEGDEFVSKQLYEPNAFLILFKAHRILQRSATVGHTISLGTSAE